MKIPYALPVLDGSRQGGAFSKNRHTFGLSGNPFIEIGQSARTDIQVLVEPIIDELALQTEVVKVEADWVSGSALRVEPETYKQISVIGPELSPQEIRSQSIVDAYSLDAIAERLEKGALAPYLSATQQSQIRKIRSDLAGVISNVQQMDLASISADHLSLSEEHLKSHLSAVQGLLSTAEKQIVSSEGAGVPVREPGESAVNLPLVIAAAAVVGGVFLILDLA